MVWMFVSPPPHLNSYIEILSTTVIVLGGTAFGREWGHEGGSLTNGISALIKTPKTPWYTLIVRGKCGARSSFGAIHSLGCWMQPIACSCIASELRMAFSFSNGWEKQFTTWKWSAIQISVAKELGGIEQTLLKGINLDWVVNKS